MDMDKQGAPGRADDHAGHADKPPGPGKATQATAHAASIPADGGGGAAAYAPDLGATAQLSKNLGTTYFPGPKGTVISVDLSARIFGNSHTSSSASISGGVTSDGGKPSGNVGFTYGHAPFNITLTDDPIAGHKLNAQTSVGGSWHSLNGKTTIIAKGDDLQIKLDGYVKVPGAHGAYTNLGIGVYLDVKVLKKPPRGVEPEPEPITIPVKVLIPTLAAVAGGIGLLTILEGVGLLALA